MNYIDVQKWRCDFCLKIPKIVNLEAHNLSQKHIKSEEKRTFSKYYLCGICNVDVKASKTYHATSLGHVRNPNPNT